LLNKKEKVPTSEPVSIPPAPKAADTKKEVPEDILKKVLE
jgi:hypothetical protein